MESNNLPAVLEALTVNSSNKNIIKSTIIQNEFNNKILYSTLALLAPALFFPMIGIPLLASATFAKKLIKSKKLTLELENKERIKITNITNSVPALTEAMENNQTTIFVVNDEDVEDAVILPNEQESEIEKFIRLLKENEKIFIKNNDIWTIRYNKEFTQLKDFKGPNYVHYLLQNPYKECSLWELNTAINKPDREQLYVVADQNANLKSKDEEKKEEIQYKSAPYDEVNEAYNRLNEYKKRLERLNDLIEEAEASNDIDMLLIIDKSKKEREILSKEINRINYEIKHKNFDRTTDKKEDEKIRQAISQAYKQFRKTINTEKLSNLHKHLTRSIVTGNIYKYDPEGSDISWLLDL